MKKRPNISIKVINTIYIAFLSVFFVAFFVISFMTNRRFSNLQQSIKHFMLCENSSKIIENTSFYLTEQAGLFVITKNPAFAVNFVEERNKNQNQIALEQLEEVYGSEDVTYSRLVIAMGQSENLCQLQAYALRLVYEANKESIDSAADDIPFPSEIKDIAIKASDAALSKEEMEAAAYEVLYGDGSLIYRERVNSNCSIIIKDLETNIINRLQITSGNLEKSLHRMESIQVLMFILSILLFGVLALFVLIPIRNYRNDIKNDLKVNPSGISEVKYLGEIYNSFHEKKEKNENELKKSSDMDALTGIMNRRSFEKISKKMSVPGTNLALILIDLDNFKSVNDTYGHTIGDKTLKRLANALTTTFRRDDYIFRTGGDEFAAILPEFSEKNKNLITMKVGFINQKISQKIGDTPGFTISVGAAISSDGYSQELYQKADKALYSVKENGRNGCAIYEG